MEVGQNEGQNHQALPKTHVICQQSTNYTICPDSLMTDTPGKRSALMRKQLGLDGLAGLHLLLQHSNVKPGLERLLHPS